MRLALAIFAIAFAALAAFAQSTPGIALFADPFTVIWPLEATECGSFLIFYNSTAATTAGNYLFTPDLTFLAAVLYPAGVGYLDWICNIPAGQGFFLGTMSSGIAVPYYYYAVQSGSSTCLGPLSTTYNDLDFATSVYQTYTSHSYLSTPGPSLPVLYACLPVFCLS